MVNPLIPLPKQPDIMAQPLVIERQQFLANPMEVERQRQHNTLVFGAVTGLMVGAATAIFARGSANRWLTTSAIAGAGALAGGYVGQRYKTHEETDSTALLNASINPGGFAAAIKSEMDQNRSNSFWNGFLLGGGFFPWVW